MLRVKTLDCSFLQKEVQQSSEGLLTIHVSIIINTAHITFSVLDWGSLYKLLQVIVDASTYAPQQLYHCVITNTLIGAAILFWPILTYGLC